jgi:hypothetical protein
MMMKALKSITVTLFMFISSVGTAIGDGKQESFLGRAYDQETGKPLYKAIHQIELNKSGEYERYVVDYLSVGGEPIARKQLDFSQTQPGELFRPHLDFFDFRNRDQVKTRNVSAGKIALTRTQETDETVAYDSKELLVVDAGFDRLVASRWDALVAGKELEFEFLALTRASLVTLALGQTEDQPGDGRIRLSITASNWLLGLLMSPIFLEYDLETRRLLRYEGLTNIARSLEGEPSQVLDENYRAIIEYEYDVSLPTDSKYAAQGRESDHS